MNIVSQIFTSKSHLPLSERGVMIREYAKNIEKYTFLCLKGFPLARAGIAGIRMNGGIDKIKEPMSPY